MGVVPAAAISSAIFAALHHLDFFNPVVIYLGQMDTHEWRVLGALILMKFMIGMVAAYLYERIGSFFAIAALHGVINYYVLIYSGDFLSDAFYANVITANLFTWSIVVGLGMIGFLLEGTGPLWVLSQKPRQVYHLTPGNDLFCVRQVKKYHKKLKKGQVRNKPTLFTYRRMKNVAHTRGLLYLHHQTKHLYQLLK
jgi:hypothetical protein